MLIDARTQSLILNAPDPFLVRALIPKSRTIDFDGYNLAVKHDTDSTRVLRNLGFDAPAPIHTSYDWPGKYTPFDHQRVMAEFMTLNWRAFNLSEMGTGKSAAALWGSDWMKQQGIINKVLVVTPLSTLETVWTKDIFEVLMHRTCAVVHGDREKRRKAMDVDADYYILNHDGVKIGEIARLVRARKDINYIIVDEGSMFRNHDREKFKALEKMIRPDQGIWWMTGTPTPNEPADAWAQVRIVNKTKVPQFFGQFKRQTMMNISTYKWVPKKGAKDMVYAVMQPAIRFKKKDCMDLPPVVTLDRQAGLTKEQVHAAKDIMDEMCVLLREDDLRKNSGKPTMINAVNAADKIGKLRQIFCGAIKAPDDTNRYITLPHAPRLNTLIEMIEGASAKVLVIVPFKGIIQVLAEEVGKHYSGGILNGDVPIRRRNELIRDFKTTKDPHIMFCHPKVMAHGINMTEADTTLFYAPIYSNDEYQQVIERMNRAGQTRKMTIGRIAAHPLEWEIYKQVDERKLSQDNLLDLYRMVATHTLT